MTSLSIPDHSMFIAAGDDSEVYQPTILTSRFEDGLTLAPKKEILLERTEEIFNQMTESATRMKIPKKIVDKIDIVYDLDSLNISPSVSFSRSDQRIKLNIPLFYLIKYRDLQEKNEIADLFQKAIFSQTPTQEQIQTCTAFLEFLADEEGAKNTKSFVLHHELGHIFHGDIHTRPKTAKESQKREKRADLTAALFSGQAPSAIRCFDLVDRKVPLPEDNTHPPLRKRMRYLEKYLNDPIGYLQKQTKKLR